MRNSTFLKSFLLLCALIVGAGTSWAEDYKWVKTNISALSDGDIVVVLETAKYNRALLNAEATSSGSVKASAVIELSSDGTEISSTVSDDIQWVFGGSSTSFTLKSNDTGSRQLWCRDNNDALRVKSTSPGSNYVGTFTWDDTYKMMKSTSLTRYVGLWKNGDSDYQWRAYASQTSTNIKDTQTSFYKRTIASSDPSSNVAFAETAPSIDFPAQTTYSQTATTAAGYTGVVTYEITANTAGATIDGSTVTVTQGGSVTVKATAPAIVGSFAESEAIYTLTVNDTRVATELSYAVGTQTIAMGEVLAAPELTNPNGVPVTYSSDDEGVATVDEDGNVTGISKGITTITATFAGNTSYLPCSASYEIIVTKALAANSIWYESFDTNDEVGGNDGIWSSITTTPSPVFDLTGWTYDKGYGAYQCVRTGKKGYFVSPDLGVSGNVILKFKMESWGSDTGNGYVDIVGEGKFEDNKTQAKVALKKSGTWTEFSLKIKGVTPETKVKFSDNGADKRLFLDEVEILWDISATVTDAGWATWVAPMDVTIPSGVEAYAVALNGNKTSLTALTDIPAGTPVLLKNEGTFQFPLATTTPAAVTTALKVSDGTGVANAYVLAKPAGHEVGFYKWTDAQALPAGKVYLVYPGTSAPDFISLDGDATDISEKVTVISEQFATDPVYNLNGQRVAQPTKGLYIVNGKKVIIK